MAKGITFIFKEKSKKKRKGLHSKNKSRTKNGKQYKKIYNGQGR
jgi:hypothetical protein